MITARRFALALSVSLVLAGPGCAEPWSCGDGVLDTGKACLVEQRVGTEPLLAVGDADGDGRVDAVVVVDQDARRVAVRLGQADGTFGPPGPGVITPELATAATVGDADGDGAAEVLLWSPSAGAGELCGHALEPGGTLAPRWCHATLEPTGEPGRLLVGALGPGGEAGFAAWAEERVQVVIEPGGAATEAWIDLPITDDGTVPLALGDLDGDGRDSLLWVEDGELQQHAAPWAAPTVASIPAGPSHAVVADYDGDGIDDVALVRWPCAGSGPMQALLSSRGEVEVLLETGDACSEPLAGDLDGDGRAELLAIDGQGLQVVWGHELATEATAEAMVADGPTSMPYSGQLVGDVNGDGLADVMRTAQGDVGWPNGYFPRWIVEVWVTDP